MALGGGDHPLEQATVGLLDVGASPELGLRVAQAQGERVPKPFELARIEHSRAADGPDPPVEPLAGKGGGEELAEAPLEPGDLAAQVVACAALRGLGHRGTGEHSARFRRQGLDLLERLGHSAAHHFAVL